jgi:cystathionine gamma-lyase/cystathionine gamma-lyase/homocysteine desulfhydrase
MDKTTRSLHAKANVERDAPTTTPIYQASAFEAHSDYFYTRNDNPNISEFEEAVAIIEETKYAIGVTTGMAAINIVLNLLKPGQTLLINKHLYGCSFKLFQWFCENYNIELIIEDLSDSKNWDKLPKVDMVLFETPTNPFLYTINIKKLTETIKDKQKCSYCCGQYLGNTILSKTLLSWCGHLFT